jgi:hypothetical protein
MNLSVECGDCTSFAEHARSAYQPLLARYGFELVDCSSDHDGRECALMYRNRNAALLFDLSDGAEATAISDRDAPFPVNGWTGVDGNQGWYSVVGLIEYLDKKKLMTRKLMDKLMRGERDYFAWEAPLVNNSIERLLGLFAPGKPRTWQDDFAKYVRTRRYG